MASYETRSFLSTFKCMPWHFHIQDYTTIHAKGNFKHTEYLLFCYN